MEIEQAVHIGQNNYGKGVNLQVLQFPDRVSTMCLSS